MHPNSLSYLKTTIPAAIAGMLIIGLTVSVMPHQVGVAKVLVGSVGWLLGLTCGCVALGGLVVLHRSRILAAGGQDLFLRFNTGRDLEALSSGQLGWGIWLRRLGRLLSGASCLLVGDVVTIRSLQEIEATLDESGCLDGLPFMVEMAAFCGRRFRVYRSVDKIYDYGRSKTLRRLKDVVLLGALRCDGGGHGGCQAGCHLLWKTAWLKTVPEGSAEIPVPQDDQREKTLLIARANLPDPAAPPIYTCQYTQLSVASSPMSGWDVRQDLRPLLAGNVTFAAFCVAVLTRVFNAAQRLRGGSDFPSIPRSALKKTPLVTLGLAPRDPVRVLRSDEIARTLDERSRNRGLWFDREMLKHCGRRYQASRRVERLIDIATGRMVEIATPCVVLEGADSSGEFLRLCAQHEYLFWREAWLSPALRPVRPPHPHTGRSDTIASSLDRPGT